MVTTTSQTGSVPCECSEDFGPCEDHSTVLVMRDGASMRSADELCELFVMDAVQLGAELSASGRILMAEVAADFAATGESWLSDPDLADALRDLTNQVESDLYTVDAIHPWVTWEDGYVVNNVTGGPLLD